MKALYIFTLLFIELSSFGQEAFLVRQTLSSNGTSHKLNTSSGQLLVQQSIGQSSKIGAGQTEGFLVREGFIQAPLRSSLTIEPSNLQILSYPNPFSDEVNIDFSEEEDISATIIIRDCIGKEVLSAEKPPMDDWPVLKLNTSILSSGSYILQVNSDTRNFTAKLIKQ